VEGQILKRNAFFPNLRKFSEKKKFFSFSFIPFELREKRSLPH